MRVSTLGLDASPTVIESAAPKPRNSLLDALVVALVVAEACLAHLVAPTYVPKRSLVRMLRTTVEITGVPAAWNMLAVGSPGARRCKRWL